MLASKLRNHTGNIFNSNTGIRTNHTSFGFSSNSSNSAWQENSQLITTASIALMMIVGTVLVVMTHICKKFDAPASLGSSITNNIGAIPAVNFRESTPNNASIELRLRHPNFRTVNFVNEISHQDQDRFRDLRVEQPLISIDPLYTEIYGVASSDSTIYQ